VPGIRILRGSEVDILEDGRLDLPDAVLEKLDVVICSVHQRFKLDEASQTERIRRALSHPLCGSGATRPAPAPAAAEIARAGRS